jgi:hypothetical protein
VAPLAGEWVEEVEGLTIDLFVAADGWKIACARPVGRRPGSSATMRLGSVGLHLGDGCGGAGEVGEL